MTSRKSLNTISASSLFHFTKGLDRIDSILKNGLYPRYHREVLSNIFERGNSFNISYIPMVCFCDIPLSLIKDHIKDYGSYGIGLMKNWGIQKHICPIIYVDRLSSSAFHIRKLNENLTTLIKDYKNSKVKGEEKNVDNILLDIESVSGELLNITKYVKPYRGNFKKGKKIFYNEREWRFVPKDGFPTLRRGNFKTRKSLNPLLQDSPLVFEPDKISYIILKKNKEIIKMVNIIHSLPEDKYSETDKKILSTKIITKEQLDKDF